MVPNLLRRTDVLRIRRCSNTTLYSDIQAGRFPKPIYLDGSKTPLWLEDEVEAVIAASIRKRDVHRELEAA